MKEKVEAELEQLEKDSMIEQVLYADWAAPIVPILHHQLAVCPVI